jgi:hypothetical protein
LVVDANQVVEQQQGVVRELISQKLDLDSFHRAGRPPAKPPAEPRKKAKEEEPVE